jgi:hypothetical protein
MAGRVLRRLPAPEIKDARRGVGKQKLPHYPTPQGSRRRERSRGDIRPSYFFLFIGSQVHSEEGFLQPEHTLFSIARPHTLHGVHPQV